MRPLRVLLAILAGLLLAAPALATDPVTAIKLTIINNSGYPDDQVYVLVWGQNWTDTQPLPRHLILATGYDFPICTTADNTVQVQRDDGTFYDDLYCNYWYTLAELKKPDGKIWFYFQQINSARLYVSFKKPVYLHINPADEHVTWATVREPNHLDTGDPNYKTLYDKFEFTYNTANILYANHTNVDFTCLPLKFEMRDVSGNLIAPGARGFARTRASIFGSLSCDPLLQPLKTPYRLYSPKAVTSSTPSPTFPPISFPVDYLEPYIEYVWTKCWQTEGALVITEPGFTARGHISGGVLSLKVDGIVPDETHTINRPTSNQVLDCNGVFLKTGSEPFITRDGVLKDEIASALNRSVMHLAFNQWAVKDNFYKNTLPEAQKANFRTNVYARDLHPLAIDEKIYGYAWDDKYGWDPTLSAAANTATDLILTINNCRSPVTPMNSLLLAD